MNRRGFLAALAGAAAAYDPERLLWVPGAKTISIPAEQPIEWIAATREFMDERTMARIRRYGIVHITTKYGPDGTYVTLSNGRNREHLIGHPYYGPAYEGVMWGAFFEADAAGTGSSKVVAHA